MKLTYAVRRMHENYMAWSPFDSFAQGYGPTKEAAVASLKKQIQERMLKVEGEIGEIEL